MAYTNAIYYIDLYNGSDAARTALTGVIATNNGSGGVRMTKVGHGLITGAIVVASAFTAYLNGSWKITKIDDDNFDLDTAIWTTTADPNGTITPNGGSGWADAWLTVSLGATAARIQPGDTMRISKTPNPVSIGNATWNNASRTITLATARTANICVDATWTVPAGADVTVAQVTGKASAISTTRFTFDAAVQNSIKQAYVNLGGAIDYSAYQQISFIIPTNPSGAFTANALKICLCSDALGDVVVDTFLLPNLIASWMVLTLSKVGGGNLGNNINSIALYTDTAASTSGLAGRNFGIDSIIACKTGDLSFSNPISKNGNAYGGHEGYYSLGVINDTTLALDGPNMTLNLTATNVPYRYYGDTETVETFVREPLKTPAFATAGTVYMQFTKAGLLGSLITYEYGWNTTTNEQDGETHIMGSSYTGIGLSVQNYTRIDRISFYRLGACLTKTTIEGFQIGYINSINCCYNHGIRTNVATDCDFGIIKNITCCQQGSFKIESGGVVIEELGNVSGNSTGMILGGNLYGTNGLRINKIGKANGNGASNINILYTGGVVINLIEDCSFGHASNNFTFICSEVKIKKLVRSIQSSGYSAIYSNNMADVKIYEVTQIGIATISGAAKISLLKCSEIESSYITNGNAYNSHIAVEKVDGTHYVNYTGGSITYQFIVKHLPTDIGSWEVICYRPAVSPISVKVAEIAFEANKMVLIQTWIKKPNANMKFNISVTLNKMCGIENDIIGEETDSLGWQPVTITFTPTADGVCEVFANVHSNGIEYLGSGYIAPIYATQSA